MGDHEQTVRDLRAWFGLVNDPDLRELIQHAADLIEVLSMNDVISACPLCHPPIRGEVCILEVDGTKTYGSVCKRPYAGPVDEFENWWSAQPERVPERTSFEKATARKGWIARGKLEEAKRGVIIEGCAKVCDEASDLHHNGPEWMRACEYCASELRGLKGVEP